MVMHRQGVSVTQRVKETEQPRGGYVKRTDMTNIPLGAGEEELGPENIHSSLVGLAVDYLTRIMTGALAVLRALPAPTSSLTAATLSSLMAT